VEGHRLRFSFDVRDGSGAVARGTHERVVVDRNKFLAAATERRETGPA
jgi:predicted thioesterase